MSPSMFSYGIALIGTDDLAGRRIENAMRKLMNLRIMLEHSPKKEGRQLGRSDSVFAGEFVDRFRDDCGRMVDVFTARLTTNAKPDRRVRFTF